MERAECEDILQIAGENEQRSTGKTTESLARTPRRPSQTRNRRGAVGRFRRFLSFLFLRRLPTRALTFDERPRELNDTVVVVAIEPTSQPASSTTTIGAEHFSRRGRSHLPLENFKVTSSHRKWISRSFKLNVKRAAAATEKTERAEQRRNVTTKHKNPRREREGSRIEYWFPGT